MKHTEYDVRDSTYSTNNISGNTVTVGFFTSKNKIKDVGIIRIEHKTYIGTIFHDYIITAAEHAKKEGDYSIIVAEDHFGGNVAFRYDDDDFAIFYNFNESYGLWFGWYSGTLLKEIKK